MNSREVRSALVLAGPVVAVSLVWWEMTLNLVIWMVVTWVLVGGVVVGVKAPARRQSRTASLSLDRERFVAMTWLNQADEAWLADRHFWAPPKEVIRLRAGQPWNKTWDLSFCDRPAEVTRRLELVARAEQARAEFEGINRTPEARQSEAVSGEIFDGFRRR